MKFCRFYLQIKPPGIDWPTVPGGQSGGIGALTLEVVAGGTGAEAEIPRKLDLGKADESIAVPPFRPTAANTKV